MSPRSQIYRGREGNAASSKHVRNRARRKSGAFKRLLNRSPTHHVASEMSRLWLFWNELESELIQLRVRIELHRKKDVEEVPKINDDFLSLLYKCKDKLQMTCAMISQEQVVAAMYFQKMIVMVVDSIWTAKRGRNLLCKCNEQRYMYDYIKDFVMVSYCDYKDEISAIVQQNFDATVKIAMSSDTPGITLSVSDICEPHLKHEVEMLLQNQTYYENCIKACFLTMGCAIYNDVNKMRMLEGLVQTSKNAVSHMLGLIRNKVQDSLSVATYIHAISPGHFAFNIELDCDPEKQGEIDVLRENAEENVVPVIDCLYCIEDNYGISSDVLLCIAKLVLTQKTNRSDLLNHRESWNIVTKFVN